MAKQVTVLTIFLSCSSEMNADKVLVTKTVAEVNKLLNSSKIPVQYDLWDWKLDSVAGVGVDVQSVIDQQLPEHDIYLGAMWKKFGHPTSKFGSGTEHEFRGSLASHRENKSPKHVLFFFKTSIDNLAEIDATEFLKVSDFKSSLGNLGVLYHDYASSDELQGYLRSHLMKIAPSWLENTMPAVAIESKKDTLATEKLSGKNSDLYDNEELDVSFGYLDHTEEYQVSMARATGLVDSLASSIEQLGSSMTSRAEDINLALKKYGKGNVPLVIVRKSSDMVAEDMIAFTTLASPLIEEIEQYFNQGFESLLSAIECVQVEGYVEVTPDELSNISTSLEGLSQSTITSEEGLQSLKAGAISIPQLSAKIKRASQSIHKMVERYSKMCARMRSKISNLRALIDSL